MCTKREIDSDDHYYESQKERRRLASDKETLEKVYQTLLEEHRTLQTSLVSLYRQAPTCAGLMMVAGRRNGREGRHPCTTPSATTGDG